VPFFSLSMRTLLLFTRDLRIHDHPGLAAAARDGEVLPLFVLDPRLLGRSPNRAAFLIDTLGDLSGALVARGAPLVIRRGDPAEVATGLARRHRCDAINVTSDVTSVANGRLDRLRASGVPVRTFPGNEVIPPGDVAPAGGEAYRVFTPYLRAWSRAAPRRPAPTPRRISPVDGVRPGRVPAAVRPTAPTLPPGGERAGRRTMHAFVRRTLGRYRDDRDRLDLDTTSHLSAYLRFGCVSPLELATRASDNGGDAFVRQLAWRDFFRQLVAADPRLTREDLRPARAPRWRRDPDAFDRWTRGTTGVDLVDAAMRQLLAQGWIPNRARLVAASYLTRTLELDWRLGASHFDRHLVDGDPASNIGNWQWVAGTGANPRRGAALNVERQARRFDPDGGYVARYLGGSTAR
jgi:deoxyribodipyrimidine photo-lyase